MGVAGRDASRKAGTVAHVVVRHAGLLMLGTVLGLIALEVCLQAAALGRRLTGWRPQSSWSTTGRRVLALGDSNTFGILVGAWAAYPAVLAEMWNAATPARHVEILNMGFPGTNSSALRNALPGLLDALRPDVVTIMIGVNDFWTVPEAIRDASDHETLVQRTSRALWRWSRVYRLLHMIGRTLTLPAAPTQTDIEVRDSPGRRTVQVRDAKVDIHWTPRKTPDAFWLVSLGFNLEALAEQVRRAGAVPLFITYPGQNPAYTGASEAIREAAEHTGTLLADVNPSFRKHCPSPGRCDALFPDDHPTVKGHRRVARIVLSTVLQDGL